MRCGGSRAQSLIWRHDRALFGYEGATDNLQLVATGSGTIDGLVEHLQDDQINYGLYRTTDRYDGHLTIKFVFIVWIGERVKILRKARIATHKGAITSFIGVRFARSPAPSI